jgi:hypothetical protein
MRCGRSRRGRALGVQASRLQSPRGVLNTVYLLTMMIWVWQCSMSSSCCYYEWLRPISSEESMKEMYTTIPMCLSQSQVKLILESQYAALAVGRPRSFPLAYLFAERSRYVAFV